MTFMSLQISITVPPRLVISTPIYPHRRFVYLHSSLAFCPIVHPLSHQIDLILSTTEPLHPFFVLQN